MFHNKHSIPFLLAVRKHQRQKPKTGRDRPQVKHHVILRCKRYPESQDCREFSCGCGDDDPFCKCGWDVSYVHAGEWGVPESHVTQQAILASQSIRRCQECSSLTEDTPEGLCKSCVLERLTPGENKECPVCREDKKPIPLGCGHHLCTNCARRLYLTSETNFACPCCRQPVARGELATHIPPFQGEVPSLLY